MGRRQGALKEGLMGNQGSEQSCKVFGGGSLRELRHLGTAKGFCTCMEGECLCVGLGVNRVPCPVWLVLAGSLMCRGLSVFL